MAAPHFDSRSDDPMILCAKKLDFTTGSTTGSTAIPSDASGPEGGPVFPSRRRLSPLARKLLETSSEGTGIVTTRHRREAASVA